MPENVVRTGKNGKRGRERRPRPTQPMDALDRLSPEQKARVRIDAMLEAAGWELQDYSGPVDFQSSAGVAIREFETKTGPVDYLLVAEGRVVGSIEAKAEGHTLASVEVQTERYNEGFKQLVATRGLPRFADELLFQYVSTGEETNFQSRRDPIVRPRDVFAFHKPETLAIWAQEAQPLRARLQEMRTAHPVDQADLRDVQYGALLNLEASLADDRPRALAAITMGGGKTRFAVAQAARLLRYGGAQRILFLVDRVSLGYQARDEFLAYTDAQGRRFGDDYVVEVLRSSHVSSSTNVVICTIQRLYAMLRHQPDDEYDEEMDEVSSFELGDDKPVEVSYDNTYPIEFFDLIFADECHRSIYGRWGEVLDYFDAYLVGLTATPTPFTLAYFHENVIAEYSQEESVFDGVNVNQQLYRIRTEVGEEGSSIAAGEWVRVRDKVSRRIDTKQLDDEFIYEPEKLDRAVVNFSQIRTVVRTFKERVCSEMFPGRDEVPKTIFFCKHDQHAEDVLKIIRQEFGRGIDFARKITYKAEGTVEQNVKDFRNDPQLRVAVTVEQIGTGTDVKPVECLVFMRMVGSRVLFNQMRGRGVRTIDNDTFWQVTPGAQEKGQTKEYSVLVDCVGITDEETALIDAKPVSEVKPSVPLKKLLNDVGMGLTDDDTLKAVALRLVRLNGKLTDDERDEFAASAGGERLTDIIGDLRQAADEDFQAATAREQTGKEEPTEEELATARKTLVDHAIGQLRRREVRDKLEALQLQVTEQYIHLGGHDQLVSAAFVEDPFEAKGVIERWREFVEEHHDEYLALKAYYAQPYRLRPTLKDIKQLAAAISRPPLNLTPEKVWSAYEALDASKVRGHGGKLDADLVRLIRYTMQADEELVPYEEVVKLRFEVWLSEQESAGRKFGPEQLRWLTMFRDYIAESMCFDPTEDYDFPPFSLEGGATAAYQLFGRDLSSLVGELNEALVAA
jgi:type I restriction enzyme, R subunit